IRSGRQDGGWRAAPAPPPAARSPPRTHWLIPGVPALIVPAPGRGWDLRPVAGAHDSGHPAPAVPGGNEGKRAPAAPDIQYMRIGGQIEAVHHLDQVGLLPGRM